MQIRFDFIFDDYYLNKRQFSMCQVETSSKWIDQIKKKCEQL